MFQKEEQQVQTPGGRSVLGMWKEEQRLLGLEDQRARDVGEGQGREQVGDLFPRK